MFWKLLLWELPPPPPLHMTLLGSIGRIWAESRTLCSLVPFERVFTGRVPTTEEYPFPFVSILPGGGRQVYRSDRHVGFRRSLGFHVWTDPDHLTQGELIATEIQRAYANQAWRYGYGAVIDVLSGGPPTSRQINEPTFQAWEVVQALTLCAEEDRVDIAECLPSRWGSASQSSGEGGSV